MASSSSYPKPRCNLHAPHVLVVSALEQNRESLVDLFNSRSWRVSEAGSLVEAMKVLNPGRNKDSKIDLVCAVHFYERPTRRVIYDTQPTLNAMELLTKIKESPNTKDLPVVVTTSFREPDDITFMEAGAAAFYTYPMNGYDVLNFVELLGFPIEFAHCDEDYDLD